jgi:hypothetical protein
VLPGLQPGARPISCGSMFHKNGIKTIDGPGADSRPVLPGLQPGARPISCGSMFHKNGIKTIDGPIAPLRRIQPNSSFP